MLRKLIISTTTLVLLSGIGMSAYAQGGFSGGTYTQGGFQGPVATPTLVTVEQAKAAPDDTLVLLQGYIIEQIRKEDYTFKDDTGTIRVDIDHDKWAGQNITPETLVEIWGELDKGRNSIDIDVKSIRVVQ